MFSGLARMVTGEVAQVMVGAVARVTAAGLRAAGVAAVVIVVVSR